MVASYENTDMLFFASNMPGGQGGMDIWWGRIVGAELFEKKPLGPPVNTPGNETGPYPDATDNTLYFGSDFLPGMGGYDLFKSLLSNNAPGHPINMGVPFNSPANDLYPAVSAATMSGWFTSNRAGAFAAKGETCCNDLFRFSYPHQQLRKYSRRTVRYPAGHGEVGRHPPEAHHPRSAKSCPSAAFYNDEPDPRSWDTTTTLDYAYAYRSYSAKEPAYDSAWAATSTGKSAIDAFFAQQVDQGFAQLNDFIALLKQALGEGQQITLQVRGYASPIRQKRLQQEPLAASHQHAGELHGSEPGNGEAAPLSEWHGEKTAAVTHEDGSHLSGKALPTLGQRPLGRPAAFGVQRGRSERTEDQVEQVQIDHR